MTVLYPLLGAEQKIPNVWIEGKRFFGVSELRLLSARDFSYTPPGSGPETLGEHVAHDAHGMACFEFYIGSGPDVGFSVALNRPAT